MTRLCVLQTGDNNPKMATPVPGYEALFRSMFAPHPSIKPEFIQVRHGEFPDDLSSWDAFLITGSAAGVYDGFDWIEPLKQLIRDIVAIGKPLVGVCFGHQIIAEALGGKAVKSDKGWILGVRDLPLHAATENLTGDHFKLLYVHQDQVITAPDGAEVIAGDALCPIAAYRIGEKVLSFQGHPEFTSEVVGAIIDFREDSIGAEVAAKARPTLAESHDGATVAETIARFIETKQPQSSVA